MGEESRFSGRKKPIVAERILGTVKWFNVKNGYGFINRNDTHEDIFVHQTAITRNQPTEVAAQRWRRVARTRPTGARSDPAGFHVAINEGAGRRQGVAEGKIEGRKQETETHRGHCHRTRTRATRLLDGGSWTAWGGPTLGDTNQRFRGVPRAPPRAPPPPPLPPQRFIVDEPRPAYAEEEVFNEPPPRRPPRRFRGRYFRRRRGRSRSNMEAVGQNGSGGGRFQSNLEMTGRNSSGRNLEEGVRGGNGGSGNRSQEDFQDRGSAPSWQRPPPMYRHPRSHRRRTKSPSKKAGARNRRENEASSGGDSLESDDLATLPILWYWFSCHDAREDICQLLPGLVS
ncbi:hypothetical protein MRX96_036550 [Rhipicephalus microplus]